MQNRGQAATEYLTTYGFAILAFLTVGGVLWYFGYLNPDQFAPNSCGLGSQLECEDFLVTEHKLYLTLANNLPDTITITSVESELFPVHSCSFPVVYPSSRQEVVCTISAIIGQRSTMDVTIGFRRGSGPEHFVKGSITTKVLNDEAITYSCPDNDFDEWQAIVCGGSDCNDNNPNVHPGAVDYCSGGNDEDCDEDSSAVEPGCQGCDYDLDGIDSETCGGSDCLDSNKFIYPLNSNNYCDCSLAGDGIDKGAAEVIDGVDNDCDGMVDEGNALIEDCGTPGDQDGDGCSDGADSDCGGTEQCTTSIDDDCDLATNCLDIDCWNSNCLYCENEVKDWIESDVDCGSWCGPCSIGSSCITNDDCENTCSGGVCT